MKWSFRYVKLLYGLPVKIIFALCTFKSKKKKICAILFYFIFGSKCPDQVCLEERTGDAQYLSTKVDSEAKNKNIIWCPEATLRDGKYSMIDQRHPKFRFLRFCCLFDAQSSGKI